MPSQTKDINNFIEAFKNAGGHRPLVGLKQPATHPYMCCESKEDNSIKLLTEHGKNVYYRVQLS